MSIKAQNWREFCKEQRKYAIFIKKIMSIPDLEVMLKIISELPIKDVIILGDILSSNISLEQAREETIKMYKKSKGIM